MKHRYGKYESIEYHLTYFYKCVVFSLALLYPSVLLRNCTVIVRLWSLNGWERHPFVSKLRLYASSSTWQQVRADVETEFR